MYAAEKTRAAYDLMAQLPGTLAERLTRALHELTLLRQYRDQFSDHGRELYDEILSMMPKDKEWGPALQSMHYTRRTRLASLIGELVHDTERHYLNPDVLPAAAQAPK